MQTLSQDSHTSCQVKDLQYWLMRETFEVPQFSKLCFNAAMDDSIYEELSMTPISNDETYTSLRKSQINVEPNSPKEEQILIKGQPKE